jgi:hypothetical protein
MRLKLKLGEEILEESSFESKNLFVAKGEPWVKL